MDLESPPQPERRKETLDDNARKFITTAIDPEVLEQSDAASFTLIVDWLETGADNEKKVAYKKFADGKVQILSIAKTTENGKRTSVKEEISEEEYEKYLKLSKLHLEKERYEFKYPQNGINYDIKYDVFADGKLRVLEVDAPDEEERDAFDFNEFPSGLSEVTGDTKYYGYRMAATLEEVEA